MRMVAITIRTQSADDMADLVVEVMDAARLPETDLIFGPLDAPSLASGGLRLSGDENAVGALEKWARKRGMTVL